MRLSDRRKLKREKPISYVNFAPFVDVLFSLLIVFMIATPVMLGGINIELPKGKAEIVVVKKEPLVISIKKDGSLYLEKDSVKLNLLESKLNDLTLGDKDVKVFIKADKDITYSRVINVASVVYSAGFFDVTLVTDLRKL